MMKGKAWVRNKEVERFLADKEVLLIKSEGINTSKNNTNFTSSHYELTASNVS